MTYGILNIIDNESFDCQYDFMCGQSLATIIIAFITLIICTVAMITVCRNIHIRFSFLMILMVAMSAIANISN